MVNPEDQIVKKLAAIALNEFHYGEEASLEAIASLASYLHHPVAVSTLTRISGDDFTYGYKAQAAAIRALGRRK